MTLRLLLLFALQFHQVINSPLGANEKPAQHFKASPNDILLTTNVNHEDHKVPILVPLVHSQDMTFGDPKISNARKKKGPNIPLSLPLPHHLLVPTNLHVIPIHANVHHTTVHSGVSHFSHSSNLTHPTPLTILIPIHTHLVPLHDLTVIPLHRPIHTMNVETKFSHYRKIEDKRNSNDEEPMNRLRYYGGFGNGLEYGGHGAGHGFYAFGSWG